MQGSYTEKIIRTKPTNIKKLERKMFGKDKAKNTRQRQKDVLNKFNWENIYEYTT